MRLIAVILLMLVLFLTGPVVELAIAAPAGTPIVNGKLKGDYARITFTWPENVKFHTSMSGNVLNITFDKPLTTSPGDALAGLSPYIEKTVLSANKRTVSLTLNQPYPVRSFVSGTAGGVDLMKVKSRPVSAKSSTPPAVTPPARKAAPVVAAPAPAPKTSVPAPFALQQNAPAAGTPASVQKPVATVKPQVQEKTSAPKATEALTEVKKPEKTPEPKVAEAKAVPPETAPKPELKPAVKPEIKNEEAQEKEVAKTEAMPEAKPEPVAAIAPPENPIKATFPVPVAKPEPPTAKNAGEASAAHKKTPAPAAETVAATETKGKQMMVTVHQQKVNASFFFPWKERTASAVFTRGSHVWVIFDKPAEINLKSLNSILPEYISGVESMEYPGHTVLRFTATSPVYGSAQHRRDSYEWIISLSRRSTIPSKPIITETSDKPPLKPYMAINILQTSPSLAITDPALGDLLEVIPSYEDGRGIFPERRFVDFSLLRTAQGVVIKKHSDAVRVARQRSGLRVTKPGPGIALSKNMPVFDMVAFMESESNANTFFPYSRWQTKDINDFYKRKQRLQKEITRVNDEKASSLRTELAELYLGEGLYHEALGVLSEIKARDPEHYEIYQLSALRGAANFMVDRIGEAALDFADPSLEGEEEIDYWKRFIQVMTGNEKLLTQFSSFDPQYSSHYPPKIRQKLAIIASDQLISRKRYNAFNSIMNRLKKSEQLDGIKDQADYMVGRVLADVGESAKAIETFKKLIETTPNRFVQVRAEFALATLEYETGAIDRLELINRLDRLRYIWRGDALELGVLNLLGDLNALEGRYPQAMRAWKDILTNYPENPANLQIATKMADTFVRLFNEDKADDMEPLEALALYYEFRELTPIGKEGDKMIQKLADRLASVDLLDRAAALLSHQVKFRLEKEERSRVANRLALIYLLNREPRKTLEVLQLTGYGAGGDVLNRQRNQLAAIAYSDIGDWQTALDMLKDDYSDEAKMIRLDVFWENKDWKNVTTTAEDMLASRKDLTAPLNDAEAQTLLRLAVAYTFAGDTLQLQYLRDYFTPLLVGNPLRERFLFISNDTGPIDPKNMSMLEQEITSIKSFLDTYRSKVQESGLSSIN